MSSIKAAAKGLSQEQLQALERLQKLMLWHEEDCLRYVLHAVQRQRWLNSWSLQAPSEQDCLALLAT